MRFDLARHCAVAAFLIAGSTFASGCGAAGAPEEESATASDPIVEVESSAVKRQSIGNCWIYATASWAESLAKAANGDELNMSESYWTYWHWFDQIVSGRAQDEITTGGFYATAADLMDRYGIVSEGDFIASEATEERSLRQKAALALVNEALKTGTLSTPESRRDRAAVRQLLDHAFELDAKVVTQMNTIFGETVTRTLDRSQVNVSNTMIHRAGDIKAQLRDPQTKTVVGTLQDAIGTRASGGRTGRFAYRNAAFRYSGQRRNVLARVQRAMHDKQPVILSWLVDFNAKNPSGQFLAPPKDPGRQGGHMVVLDDYQVNDVPGFGTLKAGVVETREEALQAALAPSANIEFFRIKNSWGTQAPDPLGLGAGYHDLYMAYLNGPIKACTQTEDGTDSTDDCYDETPLNEFILPAGY